MKRIISAFMAVVFLLCFAGCAPQNTVQSENYITITDTENRTVNVPQNAQSICCSCPFTGPMVVMFGKGDEITSQCNNMYRSKLLRMMVPSLENVPIIKNSGSINAEEVLKQKTDLIFVDKSSYINDDERAKLDALKIPYVVIGFENIEEQKETIRVIGNALNCPEKAEEYLDWYQSVTDNVTDTVENADIQPPRLYHAVNEATRTDYAGSICTEWIDYTGAVNVSVADGNLSYDGNKSYTTLEQIYIWNPQLIICNEPGVADYILTDEKWSGLECVRNNTVYQMPVGISRMGHPTSTETPLALMWLSNLLYPQLFDFDMEKEIADYYSNFYGITLSEDIINAILTGDNMRSEKTSTKVD